jgi:hypothetical protein
MTIGRIYRSDGVEVVISRPRDGKQRRVTVGITTPEEEATFSLPARQAAVFEKMLAATMDKQHGRHRRN